MLIVLRHGRRFTKTLENKLTKGVNNGTGKRIFRKTS